MKQLQYLAHRLAAKVVAYVISFAYNPNQAKIFQLLWDICDIVVSGVSFA